MASWSPDGESITAAVFNPERLSGANPGENLVGAHAPEFSDFGRSKLLAIRVNHRWRSGGMRTAAKGQARWRDAVSRERPGQAWLARGLA